MPYHHHARRFRWRRPMTPNEHINKQLELLNDLIRDIEAEYRSRSLPCSGHSYTVAKELREFYRNKLYAPHLTWTALGPLSLFKEHAGPHISLCVHTCQYEVRKSREVIGAAVRSYRSGDNGEEYVWVFMPKPRVGIPQLLADSLDELKKLVAHSARPKETSDEPKTYAE